MDSNSAQNSTKEETRKVSEIKLSDPKSMEVGFFDDFKLFLGENSNLVIGVSIGTLILVFGVLFALSSNQSIENQNILSEIASSSTGALLADEASEGPPTLVAKTDDSSDSNNTSDTSSSNSENDSSTNSPTIGAPVSINSIDDSQGSTSNLNVQDINSANLSDQGLSNQSLSGQSPFAGSSPFVGANASGASSFGANSNSIQNLSSNVPSASANSAMSLGSNPNANRASGFLSNTQSQVLQSRNVQGNTGPAVYYSLAISFLVSFVYRLRKKED